MTPVMRERRLVPTDRRLYTVLEDVWTVAKGVDYSSALKALDEDTLDRRDEVIVACGVPKETCLCPEIRDAGSSWHALQQERSCFEPALSSQKARRATTFRPNMSRS